VSTLSRPDETADSAEKPDVVKKEEKKPVAKKGIKIAKKEEQPKDNVVPMPNMASAPVNGNTKAKKSADNGSSKKDEADVEPALAMAALSTDLADLDIGASDDGETDWESVHAMSKQLIKKIDLLDDMVNRYRAEDRASDVADQLDLFKQSLLDILGKHSVEAFHFDAGTQLDVATRKRIVIVGGTKGSNSGTISNTLRPGYLCHNEELGKETVLRKAEVQIA